MEYSFAKQLMRKTERDYNVIGEHFATTRDKHRQDLIAVAALIKPGARVLDIGCGSGRLSEYLIRPVQYIGIDQSRTILAEACKRYSKQDNVTFATGTFFKLPAKPGSVDAIVAVASFHHIPSEPFRQRALVEMKRVLKDKGIIILLNWDLRNSTNKKRYHLDFTSPMLGFDDGDTLIPWKDNRSGVLKAERYYHAFTLAELKALAVGAGLRVRKNTRMAPGYLVSIFVK